MAFYYLCVVARIGGYVLGLPPTLYALPAMLAAAAAVRVADGLKESGRAERPVALLRLAGYAISALAFALALARPASRLPLLSGNTLATALVGLALYGRALWKERKPAYLYAAFAALFLAYFGTHEFFKDLFSAFEGTIGARSGMARNCPWRSGHSTGWSSTSCSRGWRSSSAGAGRTRGSRSTAGTSACRCRSRPACCRPSTRWRRCSRWADTRSPSASPPGCSRPPRWRISRAWPSRGRRSRDRPTWATWRSAPVPGAGDGRAGPLDGVSRPGDREDPARLPRARRPLGAGDLGIGPALRGVGGPAVALPRRGRPPGALGAGMPVCADRAGDAAGHGGVCRRLVRGGGRDPHDPPGDGPLRPADRPGLARGLVVGPVADRPGGEPLARARRRGPRRALREAEPRARVSRPAPPPRADPGRPGDVARHRARRRPRRGPLDRRPGRDRGDDGADDDRAGDRLGLEPARGMARAGGGPGRIVPARWPWPWPRPRGGAGRRRRCVWASRARGPV